MISNTNPDHFLQAKYSVTELNQVKSMNNLIPFQFSTSSKKKIQKVFICFQPDQLEQNIQLYSWRSKTQLPIAKVFSYKIFSNSKANQLHEKVTLEVAYDCPITKLSQVNKMLLFQICYIMKQSLIGYERLFNKFGGFKVTKEMIFLNKNNKCKVWLNSNLVQNYPQFAVHLQNQKTFLASIYSLFQSICIKSKQSTLFFWQILEKQNFVQAIKFIDSFTKQNKITVINCLKFQEILNVNQLRGSKISTANTSWIKNSIQTSRINQNKIKTKNSKIEVPQFLKIKSDLNKSTHTINPLPMNKKDGLKISKSSNNIKALKHSAISKIDKNPFNLSKSSNDGSNSQVITPKSMVQDRNSKITKSPLHLTSMKSQNIEEKQKKQVSSSSFKCLRKVTAAQNTFQMLEKEFEQKLKQQKRRRYSNQLQGKFANQSKEFKIKSIPQTPAIEKHTSNQVQQNRQCLTISIVRCSEQGNLQKNGLNNLFQKNKWKFQIENLMENDISMRESIKDGIEERSANLGSTQDFGMLAKHGRTIRSSMIQ